MVKGFKLGLGLAVMLLFQVAWAEISNSERQEILVLAKTISEASESKNVDGVLAGLTKDVLVEVGQSNSRPRSYDYQSYREYLGQVFPMISNYTYRRSNERFSKANSGEFVFEFDLFEGYVFNNKYVRGYHTERWNIRRAGSGLKAYRIIIDK